MAGTKNKYVAGTSSHRRARSRISKVNENRMNQHKRMASRGIGKTGSRKAISSVNKMARRNAKVTKSTGTGTLRSHQRVKNIAKRAATRKKPGRY